MAISISKAKALCTASEFSIVKASGKDQIKLLSGPQLRQKAQQARKLRDKWRDQAATQTRAAQAKKGARQAAGNVRSKAKAGLFAEVLGRFEADLAKPKSGRGQAKRARKAVSLKTQKPDRRADRAEARGALREKKLQLKAKSRKKREAAAESATTLPADSAPASDVDSQPKPMPEQTKASPRKGPNAGPAANGKSVMSAATASGLSTSKRKQLKAKTRAKQTRLKAAGVVRIQKHISAQNKRRQAKRDSR
jgi:hypothetical protein